MSEPSNSTDGACLRPSCQIRASAFLLQFVGRVSFGCFFLSPTQRALCVAFPWRPTEPVQATRKERIAHPRKTSRTDGHRQQKGPGSHSTITLHLPAPSAYTSAPSGSLKLLHVLTRAGTATSYLMPETLTDLEPVLAAATVPAHAKPPGTVRTRFSGPPSARGRKPCAHCRAFCTGCRPLLRLLIPRLPSFARPGLRKADHSAPREKHVARNVNRAPLPSPPCMPPTVSAMSFADSVHHRCQLAPPRVALSAPHDVHETNSVGSARRTGRPLGHSNVPGKHRHPSAFAEHVVSYLLCSRHELSLSHPGRSHA